LRFYAEELEGLFEELVNYYRSLLRLESKLKSIGSNEENLMEILRWRMAIARFLVEQRKLIASIKNGSKVEARNGACLVNDIALRLLREAPNPSISFYVVPLIAEIYEISRVICEHQGS